MFPISQITENAKPRVTAVLKHWVPFVAALVFNWALWEQKGLEVPSPFLWQHLPLLPSVHSCIIFSSKPVLGNASSFLSQGIYPCSLHCLEYLSPRNLPAPSLFPVLSREAIPDILDETALNPTQCFQSFSAWFFSKALTPFLVICHKLPIYLLYCLSFHPHINSKTSGNFEPFVHCYLE